jgi:hypothetical protein
MAGPVGGAQNRGKNLLGAAKGAFGAPKESRIALYGGRRTAPVRPRSSPDGQGKGRARGPRALGPSGDPGDGRAGRELCPGASGAATVLVAGRSVAIEKLRSRGIRTWLGKALAFPWPFHAPHGPSNRGAVSVVNLTSLFQTFYQ